MGPKGTGNFRHFTRTYEVGNMDLATAVLILTDHKSIESWTKEVLDVPSGPVGRRGRWHEYLSRYDLTVEYIPGKYNVVADVLSQWAYTAISAQKDISMHGSAEDEEEIENFIWEECQEERSCLQASRTSHPAPSASHVVYLKDPPLLSCACLNGAGVRPIPFR